MRNLVKLIFVLLKEQYISANVIWSEILPRAVWRYSDNLQAMERCRKRLNGFAGKLAIEKGGAYISHPLLRKGDSKYFSHDGVYLSEAGNYMFVHQLAKGIYKGGNDIYSVTLVRLEKLLGSLRGVFNLSNPFVAWAIFCRFLQNLQMMSFMAASKPHQLKFMCTVLVIFLAFVFLVAITT